MGKRRGGHEKHEETIVDHISYVDAKFGSWQFLPRAQQGCNCNLNFSHYSGNRLAVNNDRIVVQGMHSFFSSQECISLLIFRVFQDVLL